MSRRRSSLFDRAVIAAVLGFLYVPLAILILYSFNASRLVTVWSGFSFAWYEALARDRQLIDSALLSLEVGAASATLATVFGTLAALALTRFRRGPDLLLLDILTSAPLVMPETIMGLSLLLLFIALDVQRGFSTIVLAHAVMGTAFAAIIIRARLKGFDRRLEEAAGDLGCPPWKVFFVITLPLIFPGLAAAWLLAFTLSLDDLVIASFVAGPGSTTLPMRIYSAVRLGVSPEINAVSAVLIALVVVILASAFFLAARGWRTDRA